MWKTGITDEDDAPGDNISWFILLLPELRAQDLRKSIADEEDGADSGFLTGVSATRIRNTRKYIPWCDQKQQKSPKT